MSNKRSGQGERDEVEGLVCVNYGINNIVSETGSSYRGSTYQ